MIGGVERAKKETKCFELSSCVSHHTYILRVIIPSYFSCFKFFLDARKIAKRTGGQPVVPREAEKPDRGILPNFLGQEILRARNVLHRHG